MTTRTDSPKTIGKKLPLPSHGFSKRLFGARVFGRRQIEESLPKKQADNWLRAMDGREKIDSHLLDVFADALRQWAIHNGATHYTHWFQPLTGRGAEKHDSFLSWKKGEGIIEAFSGKDLLQGEPDASSFPSGGLRSTPEARGYTVWDPTTPPFLLNETLYLPSLFFSWKGDALDAKIPLLRSDQKIEQALLRLLGLAKVKAERVYSTLGPEQEYFTIDRDMLYQRPDLLLAGRAVYGAPPSKGQELEDHYFSTLDESVLAFQEELEEEALSIGIPLKTRHNEVAPRQHEAAPLFEKASLASDHNLLLMRLMEKVAARHNLACLFHEKPFAKLNGSGKHCNWSLATDTGLNLLDPKGDSQIFLILLTAILRAVHEHALLLRSTIGSTGNDWRLGGSEAPPTILSVYLGEALEQMVFDIIHDKKTISASKEAIDLGLSHIPSHYQDLTDRNRTSFFAFTSNKFEFRAVGASQNVAWPIAVLNSIVAESLQLLLDEIEREMKGKELLEAALPVLQAALKKAKPILFSGNNYSKEWELEAEKRNLPNVRKSFHSFAVLKEQKTERIFKGVLTPRELHARYEIFVERYAKEMNIECNLMIELFRTQIFPALNRHQGEWAASISEMTKLGLEPGRQLIELQQFSAWIQEAVEAVHELEVVQKDAASLGIEAKAKVFAELALPRMEQVRTLVDRLEGWVEESLWPLPKLRDILYSRL